MLKSHAKSLDERVERLETSLVALTESNAKFKVKTTDLEVRSRQSNIRIIEESQEGLWLKTFFSELLFEVFGDRTLS